MDLVATSKYANNFAMLPFLLSILALQVLSIAELKAQKGPKKVSQAWH